MKPLLLIGVALIVLGILALAYQGITYTTKDTVVDAGPLKVSAERNKTIPLPPIVGGAAVIAGVVILIAASRRRPAGL
jgi:hypothetical protein